ncbi:MAG: hypothetical protein BGO70_02755 [Bacteroidetes bacterium 43-93]|nr:hypothetical protein [Bacteroidota bacterium]OJX00706.1 MAG: hypothetical protein BGO70_02755 [Bacteroidetes bacterium 43-93]
MKTFNNSLLIAFWLMLFFSSCKDIIEKDITNTQIEILSPYENYISSKYEITFWWKEAKNVQKYRLQIVSPTFDSLQSIILDTLIANTQYLYTLYPGRYQWRIRGENGSSATQYYQRNLTIDTNTNLSNQSFNVLSPQQDFYTNNRKVLFTWLVYPYADLYEYNLLDTFNTIQKIKTTKDAFILDTLSEGVYKWQIRAHNSINNTTTQFSLARSIIVDFTAPNTSSLALPLNGDTASNPVKLTWNRPLDAYADSIYIANDSNFSSIISAAFIYNESYWILPTLNASSYYYWKLRTVDRANNWSGYSIVHRFYVTQ